MGEDSDNDKMMEEIGDVGFTESNLKYDEAVEKLVNQLREEALGEFCDAISGEVLDGELTQQAWQAEMQTFKKHEVREKVPSDEGSLG